MNIELDFLININIWKIILLIKKKLFRMKFKKLLNRFANFYSNLEKIT